jgi:hypothetical protein
MAARAIALADRTAFMRLIDDVWDAGELDAVGALYEPECVAHDPIASLPMAGPDAVRAHIERVRAIFLGLTIEVGDVVIAGDRLAYRHVLRGLRAETHGAASGSDPHLTIGGVGILRFGAGGRIAEEWTYRDYGFATNAA